MIDLDGLKLVNDTEGHAAGDALLRRAATAIRAAVRKSDVVARVGGDEFLVLGVECDEHGTTALRNRVAAALSSARIEASIGGAVRDARRSLADAVEEADRTMYEDKRRRNDRHVVSPSG